MALIDWREEFSVGVAAVDHEHRELIALINEAHASVGAAGDDGVSAFLGEIYARIAAHFALEERIMRERHYDQFAAHKTDHEHLLDDLRNMMDDYEREQRYDDAHLAERLVEWFGNHFKTHDARLHKHLPH
jgi:hemerythrin